MMLLFCIITESVLLFKTRQRQRRRDAAVRWMTVNRLHQTQFLREMSVWNEKASLRTKKTHTHTKREALKRRRDPDGRDSRGNKIHQTLMPTMLPLITSYSNQILTDAVSLCVTQTGLCLCAFYWLDYSGRRARQQHFRWRHRVLVFTRVGPYIHTGEMLCEKTTSWFKPPNWSTMSCCFKNRLTWKGVGKVWLAQSLFI